MKNRSKVVAAIAIGGLLIVAKVGQGTFPIYCAVYECEFGHMDMLAPAGLVVS